MPNDTPEWISEEKTRAKDLTAKGRTSVNPTAAVKPQRSLKGLRFRVDYQRRFDLLIAKEKHLSGKNGPDLIEEALDLLFEKYEV